MVGKQLLNKVYVDQTKLPRSKQLTNKIFRYTTLGILGSFFGYNVGKYVSDSENKEIYLTNFVSEEHLYHLLDTDKKPILLFYYVPGDLNNLFMRKFFL